jgi:hypothetical protein
MSKERGPELRFFLKIAKNLKFPAEKCTKNRLQGTAVILSRACKQQLLKGFLAKFEKLLRTKNNSLF